MKPILPGTLYPIPTDVVPVCAARILLAAPLLEQVLAVLQTEATFQPVPGVIVSNAGLFQRELTKILALQLLY